MFLEPDIVDKIKKMKSQFTRERAKGMRLKSGSGTDEVPVSKWVYLPFLVFLIPFANAKPSNSNLQVSYLRLFLKNVCVVIELYLLFTQTQVSNTTIDIFDINYVKLIYCIQTCL